MRFIVLLLLPVLFTACIGDDIVLDTVEERVVITNPIDSLLLDATHQFEARFFNQVGQTEEIEVTWASSEPSILSVDALGEVRALAVGTSVITASVTSPSNEMVSVSQSVAVAEVVMNPGVTDRTGALQTTSSYALRGDFVLKSVDDQMILEFADNYVASSALPGLYIYLTNNPNTTTDALELGRVSIFEGTHTYNIPDGVDRNSYSHLLYFCKPFNVKVGDGAFDN